MFLQVLLETKPGTDLPPRVFFWLVAACTKLMGKNPRLGYVSWWGPSSGVIWVDECTQMWRRSFCTQPLPLPLQPLWPAAFDIPLMQMLLGCSTMSARKKCTMKGIFHYITQATMLLFSCIPQWILWLRYRIQKLLANQNPAFLCRSESRVGPVANHWQGGDFYFHFFWPTRHPHLTCYQSNLTQQSSSDTSFFPTKEGFLHLQTFQGFCPSEKTFKDSQIQVIAEESAVRV